MTYVIAAPCVDVKDKACVDVCPVDCIHPTDGEGEPILYINPDECIDCGACEPECPVEAIFAEEDLPKEWLGYTEINARYFTAKDNPEEWSQFKSEHARTRKEDLTPSTAPGFLQRIALQATIDGPDQSCSGSLSAACSGGKRWIT